MQTLTFDVAWETYLALRPRLPAVPPPVVPRRVSGVIEAAEQADVVLLDAYGVLHAGGAGFPWARTAFDELRRRGKAILLLTNDASGDKRAIAHRNASRGFAVGPDEIIAGVDLLPEALAGSDRRWGVSGSWGHPFPDLMAGMRALGDAPDPWDAVDGIVLVDTDTWTSGRQRNLARALRRRPRPLIVCNPDVACPYEGGAMSAEPGFFVHRADPPDDVMFLGKPFPGVYDRAARRFPDVPRSRFLAVGDTPHTDILGARAAGMRALMVRTGFTAGRAPEPLFEQSGLWPDFIAETL